MPTVDIPDKVCPHCGGTQWYQNKGRNWCVKSRQINAKKSYDKRDKEYQNEKCKLTKSYERQLLNNKKKREEYRKNNPIIKPIPLTIAERSAKYYAKVKDTDTYKQKNRSRTRKYYKLFSEKVKTASNIYRLNNLEKCNYINRLARKRYTEQLNHLYIKELLCYNNDLSFKDIHEELVELKRQQLQLYREIKKQKALIN